jgi:solute carrier family 25 (mitochondrial phosphate transporter), member 3
MKFGVYELAKPFFASLLSRASTAGETTAVAYLMASVVAGGVAALLLCPMESTRIRIVTDKEYADKGLWTGLPKMIREEGIPNLFAGIWAMLAKQVPYTLGKQVSFDIFAGMMYIFLTQSRLAENQIKWVVSVVAAFCASLVACLFSQPGDMILTETYRPERKASSNGFRAVVQSIYKVNGLSSFFVGTGARIVHVGLIITSQLVIYDIVKQLLGLPPTGSH